MGQKKLVRFAEIETFSNVLQYPPNMPGNWHQHFNNENPITLELACGKGEYAVGLAQYYPYKNFIGIDLKGNRIWVGAKKAIQQGLTNVSFLRIQIDKIHEFFGKDEVDEIWITFPDPQLRVSKAKKRLTHPKFLRLYQQVIKEGGKINLKTDSPDLYNFTKKVIQKYGCLLHQDIDDVHAQSQVVPELKIKTHYEGLDIAGSNKVHYLQFSLPSAIPGKETDAILQEEIRNEAGIY